MGRLKKKVGLLFILAVAALYVVIYVVPQVSGFFKATYAAEYGELRTVDDTDMFFVRNETVYTSGVSGTANRLVDEGRLVRGHTTVMEVTGGAGGSSSGEYSSILEKLGDAALPTSDFTVTDGGVVSYFADGYESELTPENMGEKNYEYYSAIPQDAAKELSNGAVAAGDPVYKIIDKSKWYAVAFVPAESKDRYAAGKRVDVELGDSVISMTVTDVAKSGDFYRLLFETTAYYEKYGGLRRASVRIITADAAGLIIENSSITEEDGVKGVYVKDKKDRYEFTPVRVLLTDGTSSVIADSYFYDSEGERTATVGPHDDVLKDPASLK